MTRARVEGLLAALPKLAGGGGGPGGAQKQHTVVETENVRYLYQPLEVRQSRGGGERGEREGGSGGELGGGGRGNGGGGGLVA